jgi:hypothetical protein
MKNEKGNTLLGRTIHNATRKLGLKHFFPF